MLAAEDGAESRLDRLSESLISMSPIVVKLQRKGQLVIPRSLREAVGISEGALMKVAVVEGQQLLVTPQVTIDRPAVDGKNRKAVFRELAQVVDELRKEAQKKGIDGMTKREINAAVSAARRDLKRADKRPRR